MYISSYNCMCVLFLKKKLQMISGADTKTRILSSQTNALNTEPDRGKLCSGLTVHNLAFLSLRKKLSLRLTSLARYSQNRHTRRCISMQRCIDIWHPAVPVPPGS